jgi:hypothetical protein
MDFWVLHIVYMNLLNLFYIISIPVLLFLFFVLGLLGVFVFGFVCITALLVSRTLQFMFD